MPFRPYISGDRTMQQRAIKLDPVNSNSDISYVAVEDIYIAPNNRIRVANPTLSRELLAQSPSSGVITIVQDTRSYNYLLVRVENIGTAAWTDFRVDISMIDTPGTTRWETVADSDYFYTTGTGEAEGNSMKLIRKVKANGVAAQSNPRILGASQSTWLILHTPGIPQVQFRISATGNANYFATLSFA